jgi:septal ring factor EnvC (AmiA/AmiB activator)
MTPDLAAIRERHARATPGDWEFSDLTGMILAGDKIITDIDVSSSINLDAERDADGRFIAHAKRDIADLLALADRQAERIAELEAELSEKRQLCDVYESAATKALSQRDELRAKVAELERRLGEQEPLDVEAMPV